MKVKPIKKRIYSFLFMSSVCLVLLSCGNNRQDAMERENNMMEGEELQEQDMMQDQDTSGDNTGGMMGNGMMGQDGMGMMQDGMMSEEMQQAMMSRGMGPEMMEDMMAIRKLLMQHEKISRRVENRENGVKTWTTSEDPEIASAIQKHVRQMKERMEEQQPIRQMDPVFREIFDHADKIEMQIEDIENGVIVLETSEDPQVVKLIQQHANRAVSEFVEKGMQRAMQPTPLPEGYRE